MSLEQALQECYASNPVDQFPLDTVELLHPSFTDENGVLASVRAVLGYEQWELGLEADAPLNPGEMVTFYPIPFDISPVGFAEGETPKLTFSISNVSRLLTKYLEQAIADTRPITVIYRQYLNTDTSRPQIDPVVTMTLTKATAGVTTVTGTATLSDVYSWPFPWQRYTPTRFPGLR